MIEEERNDQYCVVESVEYLVIPKTELENVSALEGKLTLNFGERRFYTRAAIYDHDAPSGDDYMVVDLATGKVAYEGLLASQESSNGRYNTALYKTDKMVLRKVAAGGTYPTGDSTNYSSSNPSMTWTTDRDYYIGIFMVTQAQWKKMMGKNPSTCTTPIEGDVVEHRPVEHVASTTVRGTSTVTPLVPIVANPPATDECPHGA